MNELDEKILALDEKILALAEKGCDNITCADCVCDTQDVSCSTFLARCYAELLREREANPGVWDGAPSFANEARVSWYEPTGSNPVGSGKIVLRTPTKDEIRLKAERIACAIHLEDAPAADIIERELRKES